MMDSEELIKRINIAIGDMDALIEVLKRPTTAAFIDPVCWNCAKAHRIYLPGCSQPIYKPCDIWHRDKKCAFEPEMNL